MVVKRRPTKEKAEVCRTLLPYFLIISCFLEKFFLEDPELHSKIPLEYLSHKEKYEESVRIACKIFQKVQQLQSQGKGGMDNFRSVLKPIILFKTIHHLNKTANYVSVQGFDLCTHFDLWSLQ